MPIAEHHRTRRWFALASAGLLASAASGMAAQPLTGTEEGETLMNDIVTALRQIGTPACLEEAERLRLSGGGGRSFDLHLRDFGLTAPHAQVLAGAIHGTATGPLLRSFSASYNPDLTDAGATALAEAFPPTMTELGMVGCALSDEGGRAILDWAQRATGPRMICIEQNRFSAGFRRDAAALRDRHAGLMVVI